MRARSRPGDREAAMPRRRTRISSRTSDSGQEVLVVELPDASPDTVADTLGDLLLGHDQVRPDRLSSAQRVRVDDDFFESTLDQLVVQCRDESAVVLRSASHLAGIRSLPADERQVGQEMRRLHDVFCGQR